MTVKNNKQFIDASCRVALVALLHDLGKFAERADIPVSKDQLDAHKTMYCPWNLIGAGQKGYHSHVHAAYTALAFDAIEKYAPNLIEGDVYPFVSREDLQGQNNSKSTDSIINVAALHHRPETLLQWLIATADRVASGFERQSFERYNSAKEENTETDTGRNHYQARMLSLFEEANVLSERQPRSRAELQYRYPLKPFSAENIFPKKRQECEPDNNDKAKAQYGQLWQEFLRGLEKIPASHKKSWPLWLDHFDTAWMTFTQSIPSATAFGTRPDVSLYDHSKTTAALAVALWRWHVEVDRMAARDLELLKTRKDWDEQKFLLIQGDFFGIQEFIFSDGSQTRKNAVRLLRGRSFQVSLFTELAALRILEELELPSTSQITNAAGKFLIVAPNTSTVREKLKALSSEFDQWFLDHSFGLAGVGIAARPASCNDFLETQPENRFSHLMQKLFEDLEHAKLRRFNLLTDAPTVFEAEYPNGVCLYNEKLAADGLDDANQASSVLSRDQIRIGRGLPGKERLLVIRDISKTRDRGLDKLELPVFGYYVAFAASAADAGKFGNLIDDDLLVRCWDFSLPRTMEEIPWHGYARRYINAYVPRFDEYDQFFSDRYVGGEIEELAGEPHQDLLKTFAHLACEDRFLAKDMDSHTEKWQGQVALLTAKGDVDDLGLIFQKGLRAPTFTKMAALSRMVNAFFAVYLPALCATEYPNTYTVFAGGDDFFLLGPWLSTQKLLERLRMDFSHYVAENPEITFSVGTITTKPNVPIHMLTTGAEAALDLAKAGVDTDVQRNKNAIVIYGERISWEKWYLLKIADAALQQSIEDYDLSSSYIYNLLYLTDMANNESEQRPENYLWRSYFSYRTYRMVRKWYRGKDDHRIQQAQNHLAVNIVEKGILTLQGRYKIPLYNHFYQLRG